MEEGEKLVELKDTSLTCNLIECDHFITEFHVPVLCLGRSDKGS